jgi:uncharacterized protein
MVNRDKLLATDSPTFKPMLDLFLQLQTAGMKLTIEHYELLRQSLSAGFGLSDWEELRDTCRLLWVKPSVNYDAEIFDRVFDRYQQYYQQQLDRLQERERAKMQQKTTPAIELGRLPSIPPRKSIKPETEAKSASSSGVEPTGRVGADAVQYGHSLTPPHRPEFDVQVPISAAVFRQTWLNLRRSIPDRRLSELDVAATIDRIGREGFFCDLVNRPVSQKKADLLLLIDDSNPMRPFVPVIQPLIQTVLQRRIAPGSIYRFNLYPTNYLYPWFQPLRGLPLAQVIGRSNKQRTVAIIVSDAGAASPIYDEDRVVETGNFLARLLPAVREILWVNPLPRERWVGTTAEPIDIALAGRMLSLDPGDWQQLRRTRQFRAEVRLSSSIADSIYGN